MGRAGRALVQAHFGWAEKAAEMADFYRDLLGVDRPAVPAPLDSRLPAEVAVP